MDKSILALGADIKNRILFGDGKSIFFGPDIGDLSEADNFARFKKEAFKVVKRFKPKIIAYDLHPGYFSSALAKTCNLQPATCSLQPIQHHHAHIASVVYEHNLKRPTIGVCFDGTGYGEDGNSWGGEFLLFGGCGFKRLASLKYRMMPGGDKVVSEPWRMALSILGKKAVSFLPSVSKRDQELILAMMAKNINSPMTSSAGRLFDAAAALLGICAYASYEAEGPIKLEGMCQKGLWQRYRFEIVKCNGRFTINTDGLFLGMLKDLKGAKDKGLIATKFHNSMAAIIVQTIKMLAASCGIKDIALSGGVFQNNFLKAKVIKDMLDLGLRVVTNVATPVNDLNISLGQYSISRCLQG